MAHLRLVQNRMLDGVGVEAAEAKALQAVEAKTVEEPTAWACSPAQPSNCGYMGVRCFPNGSRFQAVANVQMQRCLGLPGGNLGAFDTAEEAAAVYAEHAAKFLSIKLGRSIKTNVQGLRLHLSAGNSSGYAGVKRDNRLAGRLRPFHCRSPIAHNGNSASLGFHATAEDAAVEYACFVRDMGARGHEVALAMHRERLAEREREDERHRVLESQVRGLVTEVDGLRLELAPGTETGYRGVQPPSHLKRSHNGGPTKHFVVRYLHKSIGQSATALEGAIMYARKRDEMRRAQAAQEAEEAQEAQEARGIAARASASTFNGSGGGLGGPSQIVSLGDPAEIASPQRSRSPKHRHKRWRRVEVVEDDDERDTSDGEREAVSPPEAADIGRRLSVYWVEERRWFEGVLRAIEAGHDDGLDAGDCHVRYDDGDEQWEPLGTRTKFKWAGERLARIHSGSDQVRHSGGGSAAAAEVAAQAALPELEYNRMLSETSLAALPTPTRRRRMKAAEEKAADDPKQDAAKDERKEVAAKGLEVPGVAGGRARPKCAAKARPSWSYVEVDMDETPKCSFADCALPQYHTGMCISSTLLNALGSHKPTTCGTKTRGAGGGVCAGSAGGTETDGASGYELRRRGAWCHPSGREAPTPLCTESECMICFEEAVGNGSGRTSCGHLFHRTCLGRWLEQRKADKLATCCAVCRFPLSTSSKRMFVD